MLKELSLLLMGKTVRSKLLCVTNIIILKPRCSAEHRCTYIFCIIKNQTQHTFSLVFHHLNIGSKFMVAPNTTI